MFDFIKLMFNIGGYDNEGVAYFVKLGNITVDQYKQITNEDYKSDKEGVA
ncbi:hypothetical protein CPR19092_LGOLGGFK_01090 [Companilactobacillus paralimentarius]|jgi:phage uncharacterized protein, XkdX family